MERLPNLVKMVGVGISKAKTKSPARIMRMSWTGKRGANFLAVMMARILNREMRRVEGWKYLM